MPTVNGPDAKPATVTSEGRLEVQAVQSSIEHHVNHDYGLAFNAVFAVNPDGADDCIFYLKNTSDKDLAVEGVWLQTSAAEEVYFKVGEVSTTVATNEALVPPVSPNTKLQSAECDCYSNVDDGAVDITGLTGGAVFQKFWLTSAESTYFNFEQDVIVEKNQSFSIYCVGGDTLIRGTVLFNFHSSENLG